MSRATCGRHLSSSECGAEDYSKVIVSVQLLEKARVQLRHSLDYLSLDLDPASPLAHK